MNTMFLYKVMISVHGKKDDCKTRKDTEYCITKQGPKINPSDNGSKSKTSKQQQTHRLRMGSNEN